MRVATFYELTGIFAIVWAFGIQPKGIVVSWFPTFSIIAALVCAALFYLGKRLEHSVGQAVPSAISNFVLRNNELRQSQTFVLEVEGTQPLDGDSDWKFLLTNCSTRILRYVQLSEIRSEIGAYELVFKEIPVMQAGQKITVDYELIPRRQDDRYNQVRPSLWDFGKDHAGERGSTFLWYDSCIRYRDDDDSLRNGGLVGVCFDLHNKKLTTEGAEYFRKERESWNRLKSGQ